MEPSTVSDVLQRALEEGIRRCAQEIYDRELREAHVRIDHAFAQAKNAAIGSIVAEIKTHMDYASTATEFIVRIKP